MRQLGTVFRPIGFNETGLRILSLNGKPFVTPKINDVGVHLLRRTINHQPAQIAVTTNFNVFDCGQNRIAPARSRLLLLRLGILAERCRAFRRAVTRISVGLGQIGRNAKRITRNGTLVINGVFRTHVLIQLRAAGQNQKAQPNGQTGITFGEANICHLNKTCFFQGEAHHIVILLVQGS